MAHKVCHDAIVPTAHSIFKFYRELPIASTFRAEFNRSTEQARAAFSCGDGNARMYGGWVLVVLDSNFIGVYRTHFTPVLAKALVERLFSHSCNLF